jgi:hypothetical protein
MNYEDATTFREDLERRLEKRYGDDRLSLAHARRNIAFERLLARFAVAVPGLWSLSGELALGLRFPERPRKGWTVKIEWPVGGRGAMDDAPFQVMQHDAGDYFELEMHQSGMGVTGRHAWQSFNVEVSLAGQPFSTIWLELGLKYGPLPTERLSTEGALEFAGIDPVEVETVLLEIQAAEILYNHVRKCEDGFNPAKLDDVRDLGLIAARSGLDASVLREVLTQIFARNDSEPPAGLPHPFEGWAEPMRQMAAAAGDPDDFLPGYEGVVALFDPILSGEVPHGTWDATYRSWQAPDSDFDGNLPLD